MGYSQLTFTNLSGDATVALPANGAVANTVYNADGSQTVTLTGHNVLILFPTDVPAGPSTTLYVGRVVYTVDAQGVFMLQSTRGRQPTSAPRCHEALSVRLAARPRVAARVRYPVSWRDSAPASSRRDAMPSFA
jgi:hypothetical protein